MASASARPIIGRIILTPYEGGCARSGAIAEGLFRNLHELLELLRGERLAQILELDRIGHQLAQSHHTVGNDHLLGIELLAYPACILDADLGEFRVEDARRVREEFDPKEMVIPDRVVGLSELMPD